jgi:hypothetical protein
MIAQPPRVSLPPRSPGTVALLTRRGEAGADLSPRGTFGVL